MTNRTRYIFDYDNGEISNIREASFEAMSQFAQCMMDKGICVHLLDHDALLKERKEKAYERTT